MALVKEKEIGFIDSGEVMQASIETADKIYKLLREDRVKTVGKM